MVESGHEDLDQPRMTADQGRRIDLEARVISLETVDDVGDVASRPGMPPGGQKEHGEKHGGSVIFARHCAQVILQEWSIEIVGRAWPSFHYRLLDLDPRSQPLRQTLTQPAAYGGDLRDGRSVIDQDHPSSWTARDRGGLLDLFGQNFHQARLSRGKRTEFGGDVELEGAAFLD